jgi:hypothetical protein
MKSLPQAEGFFMKRNLLACLPRRIRQLPEKTDPESTPVIASATKQSHTNPGICYQ